MHELLRQALLRGPPPLGVLTYRLDGDDVVVQCGGAWEDFALENSAPQLQSDLVVGRPIWNFITGPDTRGLWEVLLLRARAAHELVLPFRCDSPTQRRHLQMVVKAEPGGVLWFATVIEREESRPAEPLLDATQPSTGPMIRSCAWCRRFDADGTWLEVEDAVERLGLLRDEHPRVTHGICPDCTETVRAQSLR